MSNEGKPEGLRLPQGFRRPSGGGEAIGSDDTEGQFLRVAQSAPDGADDADTEGQMLTDPGANRLVAGAREHQIRQQLSRHGLTEDARRPHRKEK
jgi:hypothetical protein